jgi:hypothetical protein
VAGVANWLASRGFRATYQAPRPAALSGSPR